MPYHRLDTFFSFFLPKPSSSLSFVTILQFNYIYIHSCSVDGAKLLDHDDLDHDERLRFTNYSFNLNTHSLSFKSFIKKMLKSHENSNFFLPRTIDIKHYNTCEEIAMYESDRCSPHTST